MTQADLTLRLAAVRERIAAACARSHRDCREITIVAVTKGHPAATLHTALGCGLLDLGENRVQEALPKLDGLADAARVHLIGPLQTNKVNKVVGRFASVMSVDRAELVDRLDRRALELGRVQAVWLQVNTSGEAQKSGCALDEWPRLLDDVLTREGLRLEGLMTIARWRAPAGELRRSFGELRTAARAAALRCGAPLALSMGMSDDFEIAVEEGATHLRLGSVLFGERPGKG